jgi:hypothetical protein
MPQLDMAAYSVQFCWLLVFGFLFYSFLVLFVLPGLARSLKFRYSLFSSVFQREFVEVLRNSKVPLLPFRYLCRPWRDWIVYMRFFYGDIRGFILMEYSFAALLKEKFHYKKKKKKRNYDFSQAKW